MSNDTKQQGNGNLNKPQTPTPDPIDAGLAARQAQEAAARDLLEAERRNTTAVRDATMNSERAINNPADLRRDRIETSDFEIQDTGPIGLDEIRQKAHAALDMDVIQGVAMDEDAMKLEMFMNEKVIILVHESTNEEDLDVVVPMVNGVGQPIVRGYPTPVKRKYVEALARAKETKFKQVQMDASKPDSLVMIPRTNLAFPFAIERDDNPAGRAWLRDLVNQKA